MRDDRAQSKQSLKTARQMGAAEKDVPVDEVRLKLGMRSGEPLRADEPTHPASVELREARSTRRILTKEMYARVPAMIESGMKKEDIAREFGCKPSTLAVQCSRHRISLRKNRMLKQLHRHLGVVKVQLQDKTLQKLRSHALSKGMNNAQLVSDLLEVIVKDNLFDAVLDDPPSKNIIFRGPRKTNG